MPNDDVVTVEQKEECKMKDDIKTEEMTYFCVLSFSF